MEVKRDELYEIRLHNRSRLEAAVTLHIDGLDVFSFSTARDPRTGGPRFTLLVIPARSSIVVKGWFRTNLTSLGFLVTEYGKSARASFDPPAARRES